LLVVSLQSPPQRKQSEEKNTALAVLWRRITMKKEVCSVGTQPPVYGEKGHIALAEAASGFLAGMQGNLVLGMACAQDEL